MFFTTANAPQAERLLGALQRLEVDQLWWGPATYYPTPRGRRNERLRPALSELLPLADQIRTLSPFDHHVWANLEAHTEAAWGRRALAGHWPSFTRHDGEVLELVCRPNLDLHTGVAGRYRQRHGNLRTDGPQAALADALEEGGRSFEALWFGPDPLPSVAELAARHGDPEGQGGPLQPRLGSLPVAGPSTASPTHHDPRRSAAADSPAQVTTGCPLRRGRLPILRGPAATTSLSARSSSPARPAPDANVLLRRNPPGVCPRPPASGATKIGAWTSAARFNASLGRASTERAFHLDGGDIGFLHHPVDPDLELVTDPPQRSVVRDRPS
jgi:hypothetical protein